MERRRFLRYSVAAAITIPGIISLSGCGGGSDSKSNNQTLRGADAQVSAINTLQNENDATQVQVESSSASLLTNPSLQTGLMAAATNVIPSVLFTEQKGLLPSTISAWDDYLDHHTRTYAEASEQITKLKASLRLYGFKQSSNSPSSYRSIQTAAAGDNSAMDALVAAFNQAIVNLANGATLTKTLIDALTLALKAIIPLLTSLKETPNGNTYLSLVFSAIEGALKTIQQKSVQQLTFATSSETLLSITKFTIAIISVLGITSIKKLKDTVGMTGATTNTLSVEEQRQMEAYLQSIALQSQMILTLISFVNGMITEALGTIQSFAERIADQNYTITDEDKALIASLKPYSVILAGLGFTLKMLTQMLQGTSDDGTLSGDAQPFAFLFTTPDNSSNTVPLSSFSELWEQWEDIFPQVLSGVTTVTSNPAYQFASDTATQAAEFATHMADLAYQFTMKIEDDAFKFAMQGMKYGYLFASRGEEVGLMADRILWMAVQIGQMADRIGEMADRIVYTEQLIVYTEMLILDFGLLIYGGMKQISNVMLMGMAIVFDRQWYAPVTSDPIVTVISNMTKQMLTDIKEYQLAVLANQIKLRNTTLKALDWIDGQY